MRLIPFALLSCLLMSSCQSMYKVGLKSQVEVSGAKKVAVCQVERLDRVMVSGTKTVSAVFIRQGKEVMLPKNYTAQALASALHQGVDGKVIEGLKKPRFPANQVVVPLRDPDYASAYEPIPPMPGLDLVIHVCPRTAVMGGRGGGYNDLKAWLA